MLDVLQRSTRVHVGIGQNLSQVAHWRMWHPVRQEGLDQLGLRAPARPVLHQPVNDLDVGDPALQVRKAQTAGPAFTGGRPSQDRT